MARVNRSLPIANGELLFCELPDGTRGTLPAWMTDAAACAVLTVGPPVVSLIALQDLRVVLDAVVAGASDPTGASMPSKEGCHAPNASVDTQPPDLAVPARRVELAAPQRRELIRALAELLLRAATAGSAASGAAHDDR